MSTQRMGKLVIVSGPSGAGKSTVLKDVIKQSSLPLDLSVSATTRPIRPGEIDGKDYYFLAQDEFERRRQAGDLLECFEVFGRGYWYGTLKSEVAPSLAAGNWVVLEIDVKGTLAVLQKYPDAITIFIRPVSIEELERRLVGRKTESRDDIDRRLAEAKRELESQDSYRYVVVNEQIDVAAQEICDLLTEINDQ